MNESLTMMVTTKDGKLEKSEVRGPLQNDFERVDRNNDGFLTADELESEGDPK